MAKVLKAMDDYLRKSYVEKYSHNMYGTWNVYGEDPNPDFGGHHYEPKIGTVEGKFIDALKWAVQQPAWFQWGSGGRIEAVNKTAKIIKV